MDYERLGYFYLGKRFDADAGAVSDEPLLYDARDLTTHAVCVGMTGSGKTGLCIGLLEEAAIDGVPVIAIDPKGDLGNMLLTFPRLRPEDFVPWIDPAAAARKGCTPAEYAAGCAETWRRGLAEWGQSPQRIQRLRDAADLALYTPGSTAGRPLRILRSLTAPGEALAADGDALRERVQSVVSGLLGLLGLDADPVQSREHILLSTILDRAWRDGRDLDLPRLIAEIQQPPFDRLGVIDLDAFFPRKERFKLALTLNNLLASPSFAAWLDGEPLDARRLLHAADGRPRVSILSIAHLSDAERMFFVTLVLNEVIAWMRTQPGTGSLRAVLYMDEVFGYLPPVGAPPSKQPLLTLLKQARAYGLGVVLATQNPVDLDYKALSNAGTWFIGRLQTERDKARLMDGLEACRSPIPRGELERRISGLEQRVFLMNNVHEQGPVLMQTRWALSFLRGPLTRQQIQTLNQDVLPPSDAPPVPATLPHGDVSAAAAAPPALPPELAQGFAPPAVAPPAGAAVLYEPAALAAARVHYERRSAGIDAHRTVALLASLDADTAEEPWAHAVDLKSAEAELDDTPADGASFRELPPAVARPSTPRAWERDLKSFIYRERAAVVWHCKALKTYSELDEPEADFRARLVHRLHEQRDLEVEKLRARYAPKLERLQERRRKAEQRVAVQQSQAGQAGLSAALSFGTTLLGALFGRRGSAVTRGASAVRSAGRTAKERGDVQRAREDVAAVEADIRALEVELAEQLAEVRAGADPARLELDEVTVRPKKTTIEVRRCQLAWLPVAVTAAGARTALHDLH